MYDLPNIGNPRVSPDGAWIVYERSQGKRGDTHAITQLWRCAIDGSDHLQLTWSARGSSGAAWSPDGSQIAYVRRDDEGWALYALPMRGGEGREITRRPTAIEGLAWSPDGSQIAFASWYDPANPDASKETPVVHVIRRLEYKRDGYGLINEARPQVFVADVESGATRQLTSAIAFHSDLAWAPDGTRLAAMATGDGFTGRVVVLDPTGMAEPQWAPDLDGRGGQLAWTLDGRQILAIAAAGHTMQPEFVLYTPAEGSMRQVTTDLQCLPFGAPVWLNETTALIGGQERGGSGLYTLDTASGAVEPIVYWEATRVGFSVDAAARYVVQPHTSLEHVAEIAVYDLATGDDRIITDFGGPVLAETPLAEWETLSVVREGLTIEAWLLKPPGFDPSRKYPVVLHVHGGPQGNYGFRYHREMQLLAAEGYLVLFANPRGSSGYGRRFTDLVLGAWGDEDYYDLLAVLDAVLARPYADASRQGIIGLSFGGYMTAWAIGRSKRFKAAVCSAPVIDLESNYGTSDIGPTWNRLDYGGSPHENREYYSAHSPITWLHRATTPTLLLCGENDQRCPIGQSEQMYAALKVAGCEVEFARYPNADHLWGLRTGALPQQEDVLNRTLGWFARYFER